MQTIRAKVWLTPPPNFQPTNRIYNTQLLNTCLVFKRNFSSEVFTGWSVDYSRSIGANLNSAYEILRGCDCRDGQCLATGIGFIVGKNIDNYCIAGCLEGLSITSTAVTVRGALTVAVTVAVSQIVTEAEGWLEGLNAGELVGCV